MDNANAYVGKVVKVRFPVTSDPDDPAGGRIAAEHCWVDVLGWYGDRLVGVLRNQPVFDVGGDFEFGAVLRFPAREVEAVQDRGRDMEQRWTDELNQLIRDVDRLFGPEASVAANLRAARTVADMEDADGGAWLVAFYEAWTHELRQMLCREHDAPGVH